MSLLEEMRSLLVIFASQCLYTDTIFLKVEAREVWDLKGELNSFWHLNRLTAMLLVYEFA
jgi:tRNA threonylcarbamoyladenosine modification (KEOPS) complex  Pcc1 subunit